MSKANLPPQAQQLIEQLHGIKAPEPSSWWPLAPGWWLLIGLTLALAAGAAYAAVRRAQQKRYRREALALLSELEQQPRGSVADVNAILKRTASYAYPHERAAVSRAYGQTWVAWLNSHCRQPVFTGSSADLLTDGAYRTPHNTPPGPLYDAARAWIHQHTRDTGAKGSAHV